MSHFIRSRKSKSIESENVPTKIKHQLQFVFEINYVSRAGHHHSVQGIRDNVVNVNDLKQKQNVL